MYTALLYKGVKLKADSPIDADCVAVRLYPLAVHCTPPAARQNTLGVENKDPPATALAGDADGRDARSAGPAAAPPFLQRAEPERLATKA